MLFKLQIDKEQHDFNKNSADSMITSGEQFFPVSLKLEDTLRLVDHGRIVSWVTDGDWSMHDMLSGLLSLTGPAKVYLSSYAFSEYPARLLADFVQSKTITELYCLIDKRLDVRSASALTIIRNVATRIELVNTHAKVTVIEGGTLVLAVIGSANYTNNKRYEAGVILVNTESAFFHKKWMLDAFEKNRGADR